MEAALLPHSGGGAPPLLFPTGLSVVIMRGSRVPENGGVRDPETPSGGVSQPVIEGSGASVLRVELVCTGQ